VKYETQEHILSGRNSYSKTDTDATFMRMKDDRLLAAYNVMIGTNKQMIINYSIHQSAGETHLFSKHIDKLIKATSDKPGAVIGDSTFGSEENYTYLQEKGIVNYLKYPSFHSEQSNSKPGFIYNQDDDSFICADGRILKYFEPRKTKNVNGFESTAKAYKPETCDGCLLAESCKKGAIRTVQRNENLESFKSEARANLNSEDGIKLRKQRSIDVESVFGDIKENYGFRRFMLRGLDKVNVEFGLISIAHNIRKVCLNK
jgi:hypothetical protein